LSDNVIIGFPYLLSFNLTFRQIRSLSVYLTFCRFILPSFKLIFCRLIRCLLFYVLEILLLRHILCRARNCCRVHLRRKLTLWGMSQMGVSRSTTRVTGVCHSCFRCLGTKFHAPGLSPDNTPATFSPQSNLRVSNTFTSVTF